MFNSKRIDELDIRVDCLSGNIKTRLANQDEYVGKLGSGKLRRYLSILILSIRPHPQNLN